MGIILFFLRRWYRFSVIIGTLTALGLAGLAYILPLGEQIRLGPLVFRILERFDVFGRQFLLEDKDRFVLVISFMLVVFWFAGSYFAKAGRILVPLGFIFVAVLLAAFAVEPFLYGAIFIEIAVIVSIPIIIQSSQNSENDSPLGENPPTGVKESTTSGLVRGLLRFLIFQTMGMPFLLITGWVLAGVETTPGKETILLTAGLVGFGFMLLLALFPFHTWILMLIETAQPYVTSFVIVVFTWFVTLFALRFMDQYLWLRQENILYYVRSIGLIILIITAISVIFEQNLGRILGYAFLMETAYILLAVSIDEGLVIIFQMLLPRILSFGTWALSLVLIKSTAHDLNLKSLRGFVQIMPITAITLVLAQMSIAGLPLLAEFPIRYTLWVKLSYKSIWIGWLSMAGFIGLFSASIRTLAVFIDRLIKNDQVMIESKPINLLLGAAILLMLLVGLIPDLFLPIYQQAVHAFANLVPVP